jgi:hypothetical protein
VPPKVERWRRTRALISHDWLERGLLAQLEVRLEGEARRREAARTCLAWWIDDVEPGLSELMAMFPECVMPSAIAAIWNLSEDVGVVLDRSAAEKHQALRSASSELAASAAVVTTRLEAMNDGPSELNQSAAHRAILEVLRLVRKLPRTVVMP